MNKGSRFEEFRRCRRMPYEDKERPLTLMRPREEDYHRVEGGGRQTEVGAHW